MDKALVTPTTIEEAIDCVRSLDRVRAAGGGTKSALCRGANVSLNQLQGIVEYDPHEFTITALAGTTLAELKAALAGNGQQLAFDPPLAPVGATLGGTVAAGLSGPRRFRSGGVRDFVLGTRAITGDGKLFLGGGKVVKNSAGFDLPKLMVGSLGQFALMVELTIKVFPQPQSGATACFAADDLSHAVHLMHAVANSKLDVECLDIDHQCRVWARVVGYGESPTTQIDQLRKLGNIELECFDDDRALWRDAREFHWAPADSDIVKASLAPSLIPPLAETLGDVAWRVSCGGHLAWIAWPRQMGGVALQQRLESLACPALALTGDWNSPLLGRHMGGAFADRLRRALDPAGKFSLTNDVRA